jgi:DNA-binding MarR family transcriptional regulator
MPRPKKKRQARAGAAPSGPGIDLENHIATRIAILANRLSRAASRFYRERYGIGVVEWRVMMFVGYANATRANRICSETDLDKGAVSRSLNVLARMGIVSVTEDGADSRRHNVALTAKGRALHDRIVPVALERQRHLLSGLAPAEIEAFMDMIHRMQAKVAGRSIPALRRSPKEQRRGDCGVRWQAPRGRRVGS